MPKNFDLSSQPQQKPVPQHGKGPDTSIPALPGNSSVNTSSSKTVTQ